MKILHTADWHLGAKTEKRDRIVEQKRVMKEICKLADKESVDIVLICGDIFHQAIPTSEAEDLFFETIDALSQNGERVVVALAGNHDDPRRLETNTHFAKKQNIVLVGDLKPKVLLGSESKIRITSVGDGNIEIQKTNLNGEIEVCELALLPYPMEYRLKEKSVAMDYSGKVADWATRVCSSFKKNTFNVFASHLMLGGSVDNVDEKIIDYKIGDANCIDKRILPKADYFALGHIHTNQTIGENAVYSGSPLKYNYGNLQPSIVIVEGDNSGLINFKSIKLETPSKMEKITCTSFEDAENQLKNFSSDDILSVTFKQDKPLSHGEIAKFREKFSAVCEIKLILNKIVEDDQKFLENRKSMSCSELFEQFYTSKKFVKPSKDMTELFNEIMEENKNASN